MTHSAGTSCSVDGGGFPESGEGDVRYGALAFEEVAERLCVDPSVGLSDDEARDRHEQTGANRIQRIEQTAAWRLLLEQFRSPLILLLLGAALAAWLIGEPRDSIVIAAVLILNALIGFVQEHRAQTSMAALQQLLTFEAKIVRGGQEQIVDGADLVPGDIVLLTSGDRVPADARLVSAESLAVNESTLTGESVPVDKRVEPVDRDAGLAERVNEVFTGTQVTRGEGRAIVTVIGMSTQMGRIARRLRDKEDARSPLERRLGRLATQLTGIALVAVALVVGLGILQGDTLQEAITTGIILAVATIPEGIPAIVTITLALGMRAMARQGAIIENLRAIHTLGATTALCTDKTGTLTMNEMTVREVEAHGTRFEVSGTGYALDGSIDPRDDGRGTEIPRAAIEIAALCNDSELTDGAVSGDPTEAALLVLAHKAGLPPSDLRTELPRIADVPFSSDRMYMATFHEDGGSIQLLAKGAPAVMLDRSTSLATRDGEQPLDDDGRQRLRGMVEEMAADGYRVLALARRDLGDARMERDDPESLEQQVQDLRLEALVAMEDPPRPGASSAIHECHDAGIQVRMVTGDHASTAQAIARRLGIEGDVLEGRELDEIGDDELARRIESIAVLARVSPEHKIRVVDALMEAGEVVAMTGDGVNDAVALERAHVGIAMGRRGTEVAKEAGDVVLTDDNIATIVAAIRRGRSVFDNILTFVQFNLTTSIGALITLLGSQLAGLPTPFTPLQVLWVNIIMDGPPAMALGLDKPAPDVMDRPPRAPDSRVLGLNRVLALLALGSWMAGGTLLLLWYVANDRGEATAGTVAFTTFVLFQIVNAINVRSGLKTVIARRTLGNRLLWLALAAVLTLQIVVVEVPLIADLFGTVPLTTEEWLLCVAAALSLLAVSEAARPLLRRLF